MTMVRRFNTTEGWPERENETGGSIVYDPAAENDATDSEKSTCKALQCWPCISRHTLIVHSDDTRQRCASAQFICTLQRPK